MNLRSERGIIQPPNLDDRTWQDLVDEMTALIPRYAPQWTDHSPSDLGMTLIELFAWLVEQLIYRLNRVPEKNYIAFLKLLGILRDPPAPARTFLTFMSSQQVKVCKGTLAQTQGSEREAPVVFETDENVMVLPINLKEVLVFANDQITSIREQFALPPGNGYLLTVAKGNSIIICLGFDRSSTEKLKLQMMFSKPLKSKPSDDPEQPPIEAEITWLYSTGKESKPSSWTSIFPAEADLLSELRLQRDGVIELSLPGKDDVKPWTQSDASQWVSPAGTEKRPSYWVGIRIENKNEESDDLELGIHFILFNSVSAHNALTLVNEEKIGTGNGKDYQVLSLTHQPLFKNLDSADPYDHLIVKVDGQTWTRVPELLPNLSDNKPEQTNLYVVDPVTGQIRFGSSDRAAKLSSGSEVTAAYRFVAGGAPGNVLAKKVVSLSKLVSEPTPFSGVMVTNPLAATGGRNEEPIEEALRRAPGLLRTRDRAITAEDYEYLVGEVAPEVRVVCCLEALKPEDWKKKYAGLDRSPGMVNLIIVPSAGLDDDRPAPTPDLIRRVQGYLDQRRDLTANLVVTGPRYLPVIVKADLIIWTLAKHRGVTTTEVETSTKEKIKRFLHPTCGGPTGGGWQVGQHVFVADLYKAIMPSADVGYIQTVTISPGTPLYKPIERPLPEPKDEATVRVADYEIVCSANDQEHGVTVKEE
jgi:hypothetical protein